MPQIDSANELIDRPMVAYRVGALGSAPLDFTEKLADELQMSYFSEQGIRLAIASRLDMPTRAVTTDDIHTRLTADALPVLDKGGDVAIEMYFNSIRSRSGVPRIMAKLAGGLSVALVVKAPHRVIYDRIDQWAEEEKFLIATKAWPRPPIEVAKSMVRDMVYPHQAEIPGSVHYVFNLDGEANTDELIVQTLDQLDSHGLYRNDG